MIELKANLLDRKENENYSQENKNKQIDYNSELKNNEIIYINCVMNIFCIFDDVQYPTYTCLTCMEKLENICYFCIENCHKNHNILGQKGSSAPLTKIVSIKNQKCQCALNDHMKHKSCSSKIQPKTSYKDINNLNFQDKSICPLNEVFSEVDFYGYFIDNSDSKNYCIYCVIYCQGKDIHNFTETTFIDSKNNLSQSHCQCLNNDNHFPIEENLNNLTQVLTDKQFDKFINKFKLPFQFLNNSEIISKYSENYIKKYDELDNLISDNKLASYDYSDLKNLENWFNFFKSLLKFYSFGFTNQIMIKNENNIPQNFYKSFSLEFLNKLFSITEINGDPFLKMKINSLMLFRKIIFEPQLLKNDYLESFENVTPFHRIMFAQNVPFQLLDLFEIKKDKISHNKFEILINQIMDTIINYSELFIDENDLTQLGIEFLKLINLILPFFYLQVEKCKKIFEKVHNVIQVLKFKKANESSIVKYLEKIVYRLIIMNNDLAILSNINHNLNNGTDINFSFQNNSFNKDLITILFSYPKEANNFSNYLNKKDFYDLLVSENDYYLENIQNLHKSDFKLLNEEIINNLLPQSSGILKKSVSKTSLNNLMNNFESNDFLQNYFGISNREIERISNSIKEIKNLINISENLYSNMISCKINEETYLNELELNFKQLLNYVKSFYLNIKSEEDLNILFKKQILFIKIGAFDHLRNTMKIIKKINFIKINKELNSRRTICSQIILNIFDVIFYKNPFICSLFFTNSNINIFLKEQDSILEIKFYYQILKVLEKFNYKINSELFLLNIIQQVDLTNLKDEFSESEKAERIKLLVQIFESLLKITSEKSIYIINEKITNEIFKILNTEEFLNELKKLQNNSEDNNEENVENILIDENLIEHDNINRNKRESLIEDSQESIIKLVYSSVNLLKSEYFYLLYDNLRINDINNILSLYDIIHPEMRRVLTVSYFRYIVESNFKIIYDLDEKSLNEFTKDIDINLENKIRDKEELTNIKKDRDLSSSYQDDNSECHLKDLIEENEPLNDSSSEENLRDPNLLKLNSKYSKKNIMFHNVAIEPIIKNFEKYRVIYNNFEDDFRDNFDFILQYFEDVILKPSLFSIYKISYFGKNVTAQLKYKIYTFIFLFINCYKFLIENLRRFDLDDPLYVEKVNKFITVPSTFFDEKNGSLIKQFILKTFQELDKDIKLMNSDKFEQLNLKAIFDVYFKYVSNFNTCKKILFIEEKENNCIKNREEEFNSKISGLIINYKNLKSNFEEDNILHEIFTIDIEKETEILITKNIICLDLLFKIEPLNNIDINFQNYFKSENSDLIKIINKLFKTDPNTWQNVIVKSSSFTKVYIDSIIQKQIPFLFQFIFIEFNRLDAKNDPIHYDNFLNVVEFLRLLCEDHNKLFQTFLINTQFNETEEMTFLNFILKLPIICLINIQYLKNKKEILNYFKSTQTKYFHKLINKITDFIIEMIQGAFPFNFTNISQSREFAEYYEYHYKFLDLVNDEEDYEILMANFIRFINCFTEENNNKLENKISLVKKLNPKKLIIVLINSFKKLYMKYNSDVENELLNKENINQNLNSIFTLDCHQKLIDAYVKNGEDFSDDSLFILTSGIFMYFKRIANYKSGGLGEKIKNILINLENNSIFYKAEKHLEEEYANKNKQPWLGIIKNELYLFLNKIIKNVEISYKIDESVEDSELRRYKIFFKNDLRSQEILSKQGSNYSDESLGIDNVIFLVNPITFFMRPSDYYAFLEKAPYDNFNTKLRFILEYFSEISNTLLTRKRLAELNSPTLSFLFKLNYGYMEIVSAIFSIITCGLMILSLEYKFEIIKQDHIEEYDEITGELINAKTEIIERVRFSNPYKRDIRIISIIHLCLLMSIILNWFIFTIFKNSNSTLVKGFFNKIGIYFSLLINPDVFPFIWTFMFGFAAFTQENLYFLYALQLFPIFNIVPTMSSVLYSVRIRYKQFISTGFLLVILMLFYSNVTFYFFKDELLNKDLNENICETFLQCFLYLINNGIRSGEGVPFALKAFNHDGYWSQFIYAWVFYFIIILIVLNIVNGIIVDTFQALREQNNERENVKENVCFICSLNRSKFESKGINFDDHRVKEHNVLNYFEFLMKVKFTDEFDLNSLESVVLNSFQDQRTDFFPVKKAKCFE